MQHPFLRRLRWPYVSGEKATHQIHERLQPEEADRLYLDIVLRRAEEQISQVDALDSKSATVFAAASTILPVTLGIYSINSDHIRNATLPVMMCILASVVVYAAIAGVFVFGYWPTPFETKPALWQWGEIYSEKDRQTPDKIQAWVGNALWDSIESNHKVLERKIKLAKWGVVLLLFEVILLVSIVLSPLM